MKIIVSLDKETLRKVRIIAAGRGISIHELLAELIEGLVDEDTIYERPKSEALALLEKGLHMGGTIRTRRDDPHRRPSV